MRIRILASDPLSFKAAIPSESKVIGSISLHNKSLPSQAHRVIREIKEFMPYFMTPKIALFRKGQWVWSPVVPVIVVCFCERGPTC
jgi:hypothetical protein